MYRPSASISLHQAVLTPNPGLLKGFLLNIAGLDQESRSALLNAQDEHGYTPLAYAVWARCSSYVSLLLKAGADPNATTRNGDAPLHLFINMHSSAIMCRPHRGYDEVAEQFLSVLRPNQNFLTHVMNTLYEQRWTEDLSYHKTEIPLELIRAGADVSLLNNYGYTFTALLDDVLSRMQEYVTSDEHRQAINLFVPAIAEFEKIKTSCNNEKNKAIRNTIC